MTTISSKAGALVRSLTEDVKVDVRLIGDDPAVDFRDLVNRLESATRKKIIGHWRFLLMGEGIQLSDGYGADGAGELSSYGQVTLQVLSHDGVRASFSNSLASITFSLGSGATTGSYTAKMAASKLKKLVG